LDDVLFLINFHPKGRSGGFHLLRYETFPVPLKAGRVHVPGLSSPATPPKARKPRQSLNLGFSKKTIL
jgi:hypothetical protein